MDEQQVRVTPSGETVFQVPEFGEVRLELSESFEGTLTFHAIHPGSKREWTYEVLFTTRHWSSPEHLRGSWHIPGEELQAWGFKPQSARSGVTGSDLRHRSWYRTDYQRFRWELEMLRRFRDQVVPVAAALLETHPEIVIRLLRTRVRRRLAFYGGKRDSAAAELARYTELANQSAALLETAEALPETSDGAETARQLLLETKL